MDHPGQVLLTLLPNPPLNPNQVWTNPVKYYRAWEQMVAEEEEEEAAAAAGLGVALGAGGDDVDAAGQY